MDNTIPQTQTPPQTPSPQTPKPVVATNQPLSRVVVSDVLYLDYNTFKGPDTGFGFYSPQFNSTKGAVEHFEKLSPGEGEKLVLACLNSSITFRIRAKAKSKLPEDVGERSKKLIRGENILMSVDEAKVYQPGDREISSESGLLKLHKEEMALAKEFKAAGQMEEARAHFEKAKLAWKQLQEKLDVEF